MERFKKRTIALILASSISVLGSFAASNYDNTLMNISFERTSNEAMTVDLQTKSVLKKTVKVKQSNDKVYEIILPSVNSEVDVPKISSEARKYVKNVSIETMPYTSNNIGYTKIILTTYSNSLITAKNTLFITNRQKQVDNDALAELQKQGGNSVEEEDANMQYLLLMGIVFVLISAVFFYTKAKNRMTSVVGERLEIEVDDDLKRNKDSKKTPEKTLKKTKISKKIAAIDKVYKNPVSMPIGKVIQDIPASMNVEINTEKIVDLDELYNNLEQNETNAPESVNVAPDNIEKNIVNEEVEGNSALDAFLSEFNFEDEIENEQIENLDQQLVEFDNKESEENERLELLYNAFISNENLKFTNADLLKINKLLSNEISDDAITELSKLSVTNPIKKKTTNDQILEKLVTEYSVKQNISFSSDDILALRKLISVEIDNTFLEDMRSNLSLKGHIIKNQNDNVDMPHKTSKFTTLSVKDFLPNLSEEVMKLNGKKVESKYKPKYVENDSVLDVSTLILDEELPNLSMLVNDASQYIPKPSADYEYIDNSYEVMKLEVDETFLDFDKMKKDDSGIVVEKIKVEPEALLKSIENVTFSSFGEDVAKDSGVNFELNIQNDVIKDIDSPEYTNESDKKEVLSDQKVEIVNVEDNDVSSIDDLEDVLNNLSENNDLINEVENISNALVLSNDTVVEQISNNENILSSIKEQDAVENAFNEDYEEIKKQQHVEMIQNKAKNITDKTSSLLSKIRLTQLNRQERKNKIVADQEEKIKELLSVSNDIATDINAQSNTCIINGEKYEIKTVYKINDDKGFYLCRNSSGYCVAGYLNNLVVPIKKYNEYSNQIFQVRLTERSKSNVSRYIIRMDKHKFVVDVSSNNIQFVVDLC